MAVIAAVRYVCTYRIRKKLHCQIFWYILQMWFELGYMGVHRDWMGTLLCWYNMCWFVWLMQILQVPTLVSQSSYDDSSWRQTAFSQSAALMSLLCPSVHSEGWLSLVCVGDHFTIRPSQAFCHLSLVCEWHVLPCLSARSLYPHWNQCCQTDTPVLTKLCL